MEPWEPIDPIAYPDPDDLDTFEDVLDALQDLLPEPVLREHALSRDGHGLSCVWLGQAFTRAKRLRGDREFVSIGLWS